MFVVVSFVHGVVGRTTRTVGFSVSAICSSVTGGIRTGGKTERHATEGRLREDATATPDGREVLAAAGDEGAIPTPLAVRTSSLLILTTTGRVSFCWYRAMFSSGIPYRIVRQNGVAGLIHTDGGVHANHMMILMAHDWKTGSELCSKG